MRRLLYITLAILLSSCSTTKSPTQPEEDFDVRDPDSYEILGDFHNNVLHGILTSLLNDNEALAEMTKDEMYVQAKQIANGKKRTFASIFSDTARRNYVLSHWDDIFDRTFDPCNPPIGSPGPFIPCNNQDIWEFLTTRNGYSPSRSAKAYVNDIFRVLSTEDITNPAYLRNRHFLDEKINVIENRAVQVLSEDDDLLLVLSTAAIAKATFRFWANTYHVNKPTDPVNPEEFGDGESVPLKANVRDIYKRWVEYQNAVNLADAKGAVAGAIAGLASGGVFSPLTAAGGAAGASTKAAIDNIEGWFNDPND